MAELTPKFGEAADREDAARQQRIASLSPADKKELDRLKADQRARLEGLNLQHQQTERRDLEAAMRQRLSDALTLKPKEPWSLPRDPETQRQLLQAIPDHLNGRDNALTRMHKEKLRFTAQQCKAQVKQDRSEQRARMQNGFPGEIDKFLDTKERGRNAMRDEAAAHKGRFSEALNRMARTDPVKAIEAQKKPADREK